MVMTDQQPGSESGAIWTIPFGEYGGCIAVAQALDVNQFWARLSVEWPKFDKDH